MLKKVIIGIICFILLVVCGAGIYIYTLDWNKHKTLVAQRLTQITGLQSQIDGNLKVDIFPQPKVIAGRVKFFSDTDKKTPLVIVNEITADLELAPLLDNKFIVRSMRLEQPSVDIIISEKGELNWKNVGKNSHNKSGNVEVSFDKVQLNNISFTFSDLQKKTEYTIPNISATVSAPTLQGPYKTDGKFIHNNSEIKFSGIISQNDKLALNMVIDNAITASKLIIDGTLGTQAKGTISFDTRSLTDISNTIFGEGTLNNNYKSPLFFSFQYDYLANIAKLDNFTLKYGKNITGSGNAMVNTKNTKEIAAEFNMAQFNLDVFETICRDYIQYARKGGSFEETVIEPYNIAFKLRSPTTFYKNTEAQSLNIGFNLNKGLLDVTNFSVTMPGVTSIRSVGKIDLNKKLQYSFNQSLNSEDFRTFMSIFGIDLTKETAPEYKKSVFKRVVATNAQLKGDLDNLSLYAPQVSVDSTKLGFNIQLLKKENQSLFNAEIAASKILFDKYLQTMPNNLKNSSIKDKFIYQLKLIPWNDDINVTAKVAIENAVYNQIPLENIVLQFNKEQDHLNIGSLSIKNIAGASLELNTEADKIFTDPQFKELSYSVKTNNFPAFANTIGLDTGELMLLKRKLFAAQGAAAGSFNDFSLSSVQKFGDTEFSYTGVVTNPSKGRAIVNGDLEIKTDNFSNFLKSLNIDYSPHIPVTVFTANGKIKGNLDIFEFSNFNANLGANKISGLVQFDKTSNKPQFKAVLDFDKIDADRWLNLSLRKNKASKNDISDFINEPSFDETKFDFSQLHKVNFDISADSRVFVYDNTNYQTTKIKAKLKDGKLNVSSFETQNDTSNIEFSVILDANTHPTIEGQYYISGIKLPNLGGKVYQISNGILDANGKFSSSVGTQKEFFDNLNSQGDFQLANPIVKGWDLDIIKFDIEQRKTTNGFEDFVRNSLKIGKSSFSKISGKYNINKGNVTANNVLWQSPVADISMNINLNLSDYLFKAVFDVIYHDASFSDVLKFTLDGNLAAPKLTLDLSDTLNRISETEKFANEAKKQKELELNEKIKNKLTSIEKNIKEISDEATRVSSIATEYTPHSKDKSVLKTYNDILNQLQNTQQKVTTLQSTLKDIKDEKTLMDIDAALKIESSKLQIAAKTLEDNYIVDRKHVYDELFNKISWVYNVASNNVAYYNGLSEAYVKQLNLIKKGTNPLSQEIEDKLLKSIRKVAQDMDKIGDLHSKMRDDYLFIIDASNIDVMNDNNEIAEQALKTILSYTHLLNKDIINSIEGFIEALELTQRDYDDYMVMPPENIEDINVAQPTANSPQKKKDLKSEVKETVAQPSQEKTSEEIVDAQTAAQPLPDKISEKTVDPQAKEAETPVSETTSPAPLEESGKEAEKDKLARLQTIKNNLYRLIKDFKAEQKTQKDIKLAANISSAGLFSLIAVSDNKDVENTELDINNHIEQNKTANIVTQITSNADEKTDTTLDLVVAKEDTETVFEPVIVASTENDKIEDIAEIAQADDVVLEEQDTTLLAANELSLPTANEAVESRIEEKKQAALNDIISEIKNEENNMLSAITEEALPDTTYVSQIQNIENEPIKITDYIITDEENRTTLKRNPVIALEIGKELTNTADKTIGLKTKTASKFKKVRYNDVIQSFAEKQNTRIPEVLKHDVSKAKLKALEVALPAVLAYNDNDEKNPFDVRFVQTDVLNNNQKTISRNKFVFAGHALNPSFSGTAGKSMLGKESVAITPIKKNKYVLAANGTPFSSHFGDIGKINSLYVK